MIDSSSIPFHQHTANGKKGAPAAEGNDAGPRCMRRSRSGLTTKIDAFVDDNGLPIILKITAGQTHDRRSAADMLDAIGEAQILLADRTYDSDALRVKLHERGAWANVKPVPHRVKIPQFSSSVYRQRKLVERFFNKLKHFRVVATRFEKQAANYFALIKLAAIRIWLRNYESMTSVTSYTLTVEKLSREDSPKIELL